MGSSTLVAGSVGASPHTDHLSPLHEAGQGGTGSLWDAGFFQLWPWEWVLIPILMALAYEWMCLWNRRQNTREREAVDSSSKRRRLFFYSGLVVLFLANGTPLHLMSMHYLFSAHMLQFGLLGIVVSPLLLLGIPGSLLRRVMRHRVWGRAVGVMTRPLLALLLFNLIFSIMHFPFFIDAMVVNMALMYLGQAVIVLTALIMWWPLFGPDGRKGEGLRYPLQILYIFGAGLILTPSCAIIIFASQPIYEVYTEAPRLLAITALEDQQAGGIIMKLLSEFVYGTVLAAIFYRWVRSERRLETDGGHFAQVVPLPNVRKSGT